MKTLKFCVDLSPINKVYRPLLNDQSRYLLIYGGAGSGKSVFAAQKLILRSLLEKNHKILLARKVARTVRQSQYSLIKALIYSSGLEKYYSFKDGDLNIRNNLTGSEFIISGLDDVEKLKSIFGISSMWIEEATELDKRDFTQLDLRLRGKLRNYKQIIMTYNPVNAHHWLNTTCLKNSVKMKTTFLDNKYIDDEYKNVLLDLKNQDEEFYNIYALGEWGVLKNIIYKPFEIIGTYPEKYDDVIYGLDFGYNNKTALVKVGIKDNEYYTEELIYKSKLTNSELIVMMKNLNINGTAYIYCDCAEPNRIAELKKCGFNVFPADKSVKDGIDFLKSCKIYSLPENEGINKEVLSYSYKQDKDGNLIDEPIKFEDHCMDAIRYAIYTYNKNFKNYSVRVL
jgi:phage terminase large subunit